MDKTFQNNNAFTLVEVILTIAIVAIITISILGLFGDSFISIIFSSRKDEAIAEASNIMDKIYSIAPNHESKIDDALDITKVNCDQLYNDTNTNISRYCLDRVLDADGSLDGFKVTVVVYYLNGKRKVSLTSFVRKE